MNLLKLLLATTATAVIVVAFRDRNRARWRAPAGFGRETGRAEPELTEEPVLGFDGMDQETLLDWLDAAELDAATLRTMERYERANRDRGAVLDTLAELLS